MKSSYLPCDAPPKSNIFFDLPRLPTDTTPQPHVRCLHQGVALCPPFVGGTSGSTSRWLGSHVSRKRPRSERERETHMYIRGSLGCDGESWFFQKSFRMSSHT